MLSVLSDRQKALVETITQRLQVKQALSYLILSYLDNLSYKISEATYFREKKKVEEMKLERIHHIAKHFHDQHLERLDKIELVERLMWVQLSCRKRPIQERQDIGRYCRDPAVSFELLRSN